MVRIGSATEATTCIRENIFTPKKLQSAQVKKKSIFTTKNASYCCSQWWEEAQLLKLQPA